MIRRILARLFDAVLYFVLLDSFLLLAVHISLSTMQLLGLASILIGLSLTFVVNPILKKLGHRSPGTWILSLGNWTFPSVLLTILLSAALLATSLAVASRPLHRGDVTVDEFEANYARLAAYTGEDEPLPDNLQYELDENGTIQSVTLETTVDAPNLHQIMLLIQSYADYGLFTNISDMTEDFLYSSQEDCYDINITYRNEGFHISYTYTSETPDDYSAGIPVHFYMERIPL